MRASRHPRREDRANGSDPTGDASSAGPLRRPASARPAPPGGGDPDRPAGRSSPEAGKPSLARGAGQHVLIVAGEADLAELLAATLELAGYRVDLTGAAAEALARLDAQRFDLVLVDTALPELAGIDAAGRPVIAHRPPVLYLTACDALDRLLPELGPGGKDYVTKPLRVAEVLTRMQMLLRGAGTGRAAGAPGYGDLVLDDTLCRARRGTRDLGLTPAEYRLLRHLLVNAHQVLSKEQIGRHLWGDFRGDNAIERLVSRLRRKVDGASPALIHTRRGFGYWLGEDAGDG